MAACHQELLLQVRDFQAVIGKEVRHQCLEKMGGDPDILLACVGGGSNAIGLFHEFVDDAHVRLIGVLFRQSQPSVPLRPSSTAPEQQGTAVGAVPVHPVLSLLGYLTPAHRAHRGRHYVVSTLLGAFMSLPPIVCQTQACFLQDTATDM